MQQKQCEESALLAATKRQTATAVVINLERPKDAEIHWLLTGRSEGSTENPALIEATRAVLQPAAHPFPADRQPLAAIVVAMQLHKGAIGLDCARASARLATFGLVLVGILLLAPRAAAYDKPPELQRTASVFAMREAEVRCPSMEEWIHDPIWGSAPNPSRAWGYTDMLNDHIVLHPALCAGAVAVDDPETPLWQRATGVLVLVHEAYHLRLWSWRRNEAKVECQAIRHFKVGARLLGASPELANELLPYALAAHARMKRLYPEYRDDKCKLPLWVPPFTP
jgi:hypothetical protein